MDRNEQTDEVKIRLYHLTKQFVYKYQPRYYKQYDPQVEDLNDLISDFYISFLTAKSREKGKEQSLLDKFDPKVTSLEYLVKIAVQRKLIDYSRQHPSHPISIDSKVDEFGDCILQGFSLVETAQETVDSKEFTLQDIQEMKIAFSSLSDYAQEVFNKQYNECRSALSCQYQQAFDSVLKDYQKASVKAQEYVQVFVEVLDEFGQKLLCPLQQITNKTAVVFINGEFFNFDRFTGKSRNKDSLKELVYSEYIKKINDAATIIKPRYSREEFKERFS